jgi:hypothetical protein
VGDQRKRELAPLSAKRCPNQKNNKGIIMVGRRKKLTKGLIKKLEKLLEDYPAKHAAVLAGISARTFHNYRQDAEKLEKSLDSGDITEECLDSDDELLMQFLHSIQVGKIKLEQKLIDSWTQSANQWIPIDNNGNARLDADGNIRKMPGDWRAAMALLARLNPDQFADPNAKLLAQKDTPTDQSNSGFIQVPFMPNATPGDFMATAQQQQNSITQQIAERQAQESEND